jgi:hypothetical protein
MFAALATLCALDDFGAPGPESGSRPLGARIANGTRKYMEREVSTNPPSPGGRRVPP